MAFIQLKQGKSGAAEWVNTDLVVRFSDNPGGKAVLWLNTGGEKLTGRVYQETSAEVATAIKSAKA